MSWGTPRGQSADEDGYFLGDRREQHGAVGADLAQQSTSKILPYWTPALETNNDIHSTITVRIYDCGAQAQS